MGIIRKRRNSYALESQSQVQDTGSIQPADVAHARELGDRLRRCLARLPAKQAQVFVLSRIEGLGYEEIAKAMDCSQDTARVHLHRALRRLASDLRPFVEG